MPTHEEGPGFDSLWGHMDFSLSWYFRPPCGPGVDLACNTLEHQGYLLGGKGGRCIGLTTYHLHVTIVLEIMGASACWSPQGLPKPVMGLLYLSIT